MYTLTVTITTANPISSIAEFNLAGGTMLAVDERFDDVYYHHYLIENNLIGEKTLNSDKSMTIVRTGITEEHKTILEQMYQTAKAVYNDNGWNATWTFE